MGVEPVKEVRSESDAVRKVQADRREQFVALDRGRPEFAHDDAAREIGNMGGDGGGKARAQSQRVDGDGRVPRSRNVEDLARLCGEVNRGRIIGKNEHALLTEGQQHLRARPFFKERPTRREQRFVTKGIDAGIATQIGLELVHAPHRFVESWPS